VIAASPKKVVPSAISSLRNDLKPAVIFFASASADFRHFSDRPFVLTTASPLLSGHE